ncbi:hypothetical protein N1F78_11485 [Seonamhaeicola sp. MEBiC1930]
MNNQFCRVGKIKPNLNKVLNLKEIERRINNFVDDISKVEYSKDLNGAV